MLPPAATRSDTRAAIALRVIAIAELVLVTRYLVIAILRERMFAELRSGAHSGTSDSQAFFAKLELVNRISFFSHLALLAVIVGGAIWLAVALRRGRGIAIGAVVSLAAHLVLTVTSRAMTFTGEIPLSIKLMWWADGTCLMVGSMLPLIAAARALPSSLSRVGAGGALAIVLIDAALGLYGMSLKSYTPTLGWVERGIALLAASWFAGVAFPLARRLRARQSGEPAARAPGALDGTPLRALAWALLARIGLGIALQGLIITSMFKGEYDSAGTLTVLGAVIGVVLSLVILAALVGYFRFPNTHRGDSIVVAIGLVVAGVVLDVVATSAANELFQLVGEAKRASSFWGMPSLSKMEDLQTTVSFAGKGALLVGIGAGFALAASLSKTATALADEALAARARRVMTLLTIAGLGALGLSFLMAAPSRDLVPLLLIGALALLCVAIFLLIDWIGLLFGLASAVEGSAPDAHEPGSG